MVVSNGKSYLRGDHPTKTDNDVYEAFKTSRLKQKLLKYPNINNWYKVTVYYIQTEFTHGLSVFPITLKVFESSGHDRDQEAKEKTKKINLQFCCLQSFQIKEKTSLAIIIIVTLENNYSFQINCHSTSSQIKSKNRAHVSFIMLNIVSNLEIWYLILFIH